MTDEWYSGSRLLEPLTAVIPLPIDQLNFLICQLFSLWFGTVFRVKLSPMIVSPYHRHAVEIVMGLFLSYFCFGYQMIHLFIHATLCYALMKYSPPNISHQVTFVVGLGYVCMMHIYRQYYDYGGYTMDITGPLMITAQKITSLGYALYDGRLPEEKLTPDRKAMMVKKLPHPVAYYGYIMCYHGIMAGPMAFYVEYEDFINGTSYHKPSPSSVSNGKVSDSNPPSPKDTVTEKCIKAALFAVLMVVIPKMVPHDYMYSDEFLYERSFLYRNFYMLVAVTCVRFKYYTAFLLSEAVNNSAGFGFNGYDGNGQPKWDLLNNADIWAIEMCTSMKVNIESWNIRTALWLRRIVYDRVPRQYGLFGTFLVSALWHGFYPGYYITFFGTGFVIYAGREIRRHIRPMFQTSDSMKQLYEVITFIGTRFCNVYLCAPFCLLTLAGSFKLYWSLFFNIHLISIGVLIYYKFVNPPKRKVEKTQ